MLFPLLKDNLLNFFKKRVNIAILLILFFSVVLFSRLFYLQVVKYQEYSKSSDSNRIRIARVPAERGFILDRNGEILVRNTPAYELKIVKEDAEDIDELLKNIQKIYNFNIEKAKKDIKKSYFYEPTVILRGLKFEQVAYFLEHSADFSGLEVDLQSVRSYPDGTSFSHLVGYMGEVSENDITENSSYVAGDMIGKSGIEKQYENYLRGKDGARQVEVDTFGRVFEIINEIPSISGHNVVLTIDYKLQKYIAEKYNNKRIAISVLDINDNSLLAMYSAPTYDLNSFTPFIKEDDWVSLVNNPVKPLLNRNIEGTYPPGSVYKVIMAVAGLKEKVITPDTKFKCTGSYRLNRNFSYNCWLKWGHSDTDLRKALATSCDVYFYNLGRLLEIDKIQKYSNFFSLGQYTGIDLPNESTGFFPSRKWKEETKKEGWYPGETVITSIGQGYMTSTPLQIGVMMSGVFNGGNIYRPKIVDKIVSHDGDEVLQLEADLLRSIEIPEDMKDIIMAGLKDSVYKRGGTSQRAKVKDLTVAGKTGTAQVVSLKKTEDLEDNEIPEHWRDHSWFTGVFPAEEPKYVIVVLVEHGGSGGVSAAPIASDVISKMMELGYVSEN